MNTDLQTTDNNGLQLVKPQPEGYAITKALNSPLINQVAPEDLFTALNIAIAKSYIDTGYKAPDADSQTEAMIYSQMVNELVTYIKTYCATLRVKEIPLAIDRGTQQEYGNYFGLNKVTFVQFFKGYKNSGQRQEELSKHLKTLQVPPIIPTPGEQFNTAKNNALMAYEAHKAGQPQERAGGIVYDFLKAIGLCAYSKEVRNAIYTEAIARVISETHAQKLGSDFFVRQGLQRLIETFELGPTRGTKEYGIILIKAKAMTAAKYFDDCVLAGADLSGLIEDKKEVFLNLKQQS